MDPRDLREFGDMVIEGDLAGIKSWYPHARECEFRVKQRSWTLRALAARCEATCFDLRGTLDEIRHGS